MLKENYDRYFSFKVRRIHIYEIGNGVRIYLDRYFLQTQYVLNQPALTATLVNGMIKTMAIIRYQQDVPT